MYAINNIQTMIFVYNSFTTFHININGILKSHYVGWPHWLCYFHTK